MSEEKASKFNFDSAKRYMQEKAIVQAMNYLEGDPENNIPKIVKMFQKLTPVPLHREFAGNIQGFYEDYPAIRTYINSIFTEIDRDVRNKMVTNFLLNSLALSSARRQQVQDEEGIHVPYTFLIDPTSACNLKCTGCWAGNTPNMTRWNPSSSTAFSQRLKNWGSMLLLFPGGNHLFTPIFST